MKDNIRSVRYNTAPALGSLPTSKNVERSTQITIMRLGQRRVKKSRGDSVKDTAWKMRKGFIEELPLK